MPEVDEIINTGFNLHKEGKLDDAENAYKEALKLDSENPEIYNLMGVLKIQQDDINSALCWIEKAVEKKPDEYFYETLFQAYIRANLPEKIVERENEVLRNFPLNFSLIFNIALAHSNLKQFKEAVSYYEKALKINPASYQAWFNLSHMYGILSLTENAVSALEVCKKLKPKDGDTDYFLSIALMRTKNYGRALKLFEARPCRETAVAVQNKTYPNKIRRDNLWRGENIKDKTILVYYEAGFGDVIMFSRYIPLLAKKCKKLLFMTQKPLGMLFRDNLNLGIDEVIDSYIPETKLDFDVHTPLMSLPYYLKLKGDNIFAYREGYLKFNGKLAKEYKEKYFNNDKIKIGIKWQGNTYFDKDRVIPAEMFNRFSDVENALFYSFQTFEGAEAVKQISLPITDIGQNLINFSQTASALSNLDLVICNDTSLAHLAGAMGIPCWVILPYEVNWRWHGNGNTSDWYDSIRLFKQKTYGDWSGVFDEISECMK